MTDDSSHAQPRVWSVQDLDHFREKLVLLRDRILGQLTFHTDEHLNNSQRESSGDLSNYGLHLADQATDNFEKELAMSMAGGEQELLHEINDALQRVENGTFGMCEVSGDPIPRERLEVVPYARYTVAAQSEMEQKTPRRSFNS